jgi:hypothetical protein
LEKDGDEGDLKEEKEETHDECESLKYQLGALLNVLGLRVFKSLARYHEHDKQKSEKNTREK